MYIYKYNLSDVVASKTLVVDEYIGKQAKVDIN